MKKKCLSGEATLLQSYFPYKTLTMGQIQLNNTFLKHLEVCIKLNKLLKLEKYTSNSNLSNSVDELDLDWFGFMAYEPL